MHHFVDSQRWTTSVQRYGVKEMNMRHANHGSEDGDRSSPVDKAQVTVRSYAKPERAYREGHVVDYQEALSSAESGSSPDRLPPSTSVRQPTPRYTVDHWQIDEPSCRPGVNVFLTLERPPASTLDNYDRAERYRLLMAHAEAQRDAFKQWAEEEGLCEEIMRIGEANSFHLLFIYCTPAAAQRLVGAPGVIDVAVAADA